MDLLYFDCFSGVSGDMLIGSLLDLGVPFSQLDARLEQLGLDVKLHAAKDVVNGISATRFSVNSEGVPPVRHLPDIEKIIMGSSLKEQIKVRSCEVFSRLAQAEAAVHGVDIDQVHFHEIGAVDTIVDIVGTFCCLDLLGIEEVFASPIPWPNGFVDISHGKFPLPAPATALLLRGVPCKGTDIDLELVTPTGAALITSLVNQFGLLPESTPLAIGYGAGSLVRNDGVPNLLRVVRAAYNNQLYPLKEETVALLETEVDDFNPEFFTHLHEVIMAQTGVLDFYTTPIYMKKNRPGFLLSVLCSVESVRQIAALLIKQTSTLGVRYQVQPRIYAQRSELLVDTPWGPIRVKVAMVPGGGRRMKPEFSECQQIAAANNLSLYEVYHQIIKQLPSTDFTDSPL